MKKESFNSIFKVLVFVGFVFLFLSSEKSAFAKVSASSCPVVSVTGLETSAISFYYDSDETGNKMCCQYNSRTIAKYFDAHCYTKDNNAGAWSIDPKNSGSGFCPAGTLAYTDYKCYSPGEALDSGAQSLQIFAYCKDTITASFKHPDKASTTGDLGYCYAEKAEFLAQGTSCTCIKGSCSKYEYEVGGGNVCVEWADARLTPVSVPADSTCAQVCGSAGNVFFSADGSGGLTNNPNNNPSVACIVKGTSEEGVLTAIGCIPVSHEGITVWAGLIGAVIGSVLSAFKLAAGSIAVMMSAGNPDKLQEGKEDITSAIIGLIVIACSVIIFGFLGVNILGLAINLV